MIWTEEQNTNRALGTMLNPEGKSCSNCQWGDAGVKKEDRSDWVTCGTLHQNFKANSLCDYWTDPNDAILIAYQERRKEEMLEKFGS